MEPTEREEEIKLWENHLPKRVGGPRTTSERGNKEEADKDAKRKEYDKMLTKMVKDFSKHNLEENFRFTFSLSGNSS